MKLFALLLAYSTALILGASAGMALAMGNGEGALLLGGAAVALIALIAWARSKCKSCCDH